ncbi:hypothetical protein LSM04_008163 [Trypanosoma melophagium]|uniref:uncharacterized protein n=1 Tax=Trypanosoma melophagium TaxID=715481 RepID=UPI00351A6F9C|nr:hypothetical protein LSM04_008163 [Trypanosoma melophagium]
MPTCLILSEPPQREKEKIMLLLAAAHDNAWRAIRDEWNNLYIEWQSTSPFLRDSLSFNGGPTADCSPWNIDRNTDSAVAAEQFYTANTSHPFASNYSPQTQKLQKQQQQQHQQMQHQYQQQRVRGGSMTSMSDRVQRGSSQRV